MKANRAAHSLPTMCRVLGVSASGYYAWQDRAESARRVDDRQLLDRIRDFHRASRGTYGAPRIHRDLRAAGVRISRKRVARLLKEAGLRGVSRRKWPVTTVRAAQARPAPDLVQRAFTATGPNQLWVADITYIPTWSGTLYLAVVLDVWSRRIVGWAMATHLRASLVVAALDMAVVQRRPHDVIHHSDQGCQYTAIEFGRRCREANVRPSMGSVGDCYDNALCESFFATLECELLDRVTLRTPADARTAVFDFIEGWYNPTRRHSSLDYESPIAFERRQAKITQKQQMTGDADAGRGQTTVGRSIASLTADGELPGIEG
jgi:putative transposase